MTTRPMTGDPLENMLNPSGKQDPITVRQYRAGQLMRGFLSAANAAAPGVGSVDPAFTPVDGGQRAEPAMERLIRQSHEQQAARDELDRICATVGADQYLILAMVLGQSMPLHQVARQLVDSAKPVSREFRCFVHWSFQRGLDHVADRLKLSNNPKDYINFMPRQVARDLGEGHAA